MHCPGADLEFSPNAASFLSAGFTLDSTDGVYMCRDTNICQVSYGTNTIINPFYTGMLGNWRARSQYAYQVRRDNLVGNTALLGARIFEDHALTAFLILSGNTTAQHLLHKLVNCVFDTFLYGGCDEKSGSVPCRPIRILESCSIEAFDCIF